jgi:hypothetical protein
LLTHKKQAAPGMNNSHRWYKVLDVSEQLKYIKNHLLNLKQAFQKGPLPLYPKQHEGLHLLKSRLLFSGTMLYVNMGKERLFVIFVEEAVFVIMAGREIGVNYAVAKQDAHTANKGASALCAVGREFANMEFCGICVVGDAATIK